MRHTSHPRRNFLLRAGGGLGALAATSLLAKDAASKQPDWFRPERARVKRVVWLFMHGGPSQVDLLDPKPILSRLSGQTLPESFGQVMTRRKVAHNSLLGPIKPFHPRGDSGIEISDFLPNIARHADDLCVIRSMHGDSVNHPQSVYQMNTGSVLMGRPSVGSWLAYGLGSENEDLPAFIVLPDPKGGLKGGPPAWGSGFLPASYQGVTMRSGENPILHLRPPSGFSAQQQRQALRVANFLNETTRSHRASDDQWQARIKAYELAFKMQSTAPELVDLSQETGMTRRLYGLEDKTTREFGTRCLLARRMLERGVRFVQVYAGDTNGWDAHNDVAKNHSEHCQATDLPVAGLLTDLKQRGLWEDTRPKFLGINVVQHMQKMDPESQR